VLTNTTVDPKDVAYNLSGFEFTLSGGTGAQLTNETSPESRTVASNGTYTDAGSVTGLDKVGWVYSSSSATEFKLDVLVGTGHAGPKNTILGSPGTGNTYDAANGSIAGNSAHNPFLASSITYTFTFESGVNSAQPCLKHRLGSVLVTLTSFLSATPVAVPRPLLARFPNQTLCCCR
jgi:hypothetical protein